MRNRKGLTKVPLHYEDFFKSIWYLSGEHPFIWNYVSQEIPDRGHGILNRMANKGYIIDKGRINNLKFRKTKLWELSEEIRDVCFRQWGEGANGVASKLAIERYCTDKSSEYACARRVSKITITRHEQKKQERRKLKPHESDLLCRVKTATVGINVWTCQDLKNNHGIEIQNHQIKRLAACGVVECVGKAMPKKNVNIWRIV